MLEVISNWTSPGKSPKVSVMYFEGTDAPAAVGAVSDTKNLWEFLKGGLTTSTSVAVSGEVRHIDEATGALLGVLTVTPPAPSQGTVSEPAAADATQYLLRWTTGQVVGGRLLRGRTFIPGVPLTSIQNGNVAATIKTSFDTDIASWLSATPGLVIWHRPKLIPASAGVAHPVTGGTVWTEFGVQRGRRG